MKARIDIEQNVIACAVEHPQLDSVLEAIEKLKPEHFSSAENAEIWRAVCQMIGQGKFVDHSTIDLWLQQTTGKDYFTYIGSCIIACKSAAGMKQYTKIVFEFGELRKAEAQIYKALEKLNEQGDSQDRINSALSELSVIGSSSADDGIVNPFDALIRLHDKMQLALTKKGGCVGLSSGFANIDHYTNGFFGGQLVIVAAKSGMGKTTLCMNMAENMSLLTNESKNVIFFSLEMPAEQLMMKTVARFKGVMMNDIINGQVIHPSNVKGCNDFSDTLAVVKDRQKHFVIDEKSGQHITQIQAKAKRLAMKMGKVDAIFIDYLGLIQADGENQVVRVGRVSAGLKHLAKEMNVPVVVLCQLNRAINGEPTMSNLRDSGNIENDADIIIILHDEDHGKKRDDSSLTKIIFAKNRMGQTGHTYLQPRLHYSRFEDTDRLPVEPIQNQEQTQGSESKKRYSARGDQ